MKALTFFEGTIASKKRRKPHLNHEFSTRLKFVKLHNDTTRIGNKVAVSHLERVKQTEKGSVVLQNNNNTAIKAFQQKNLRNLCTKVKISNTKVKKPTEE
jgi:hypothetical protein